MSSESRKTDVPARALWKVSSWLGLLFLLVAFTACQTKVSATPALPAEFQRGLVPSVALDGYLFVRQGNDTRIAGNLLALPEDVAARYAQIWLVPSDQGEVLGGSVLFSSAEQAQMVSRAMDSGLPKHWKMVSGSSLFVVFGEGSGAKDLISAIESNRFSSLESIAPDGWAMVQRLPAAPPTQVVLAGFVKLSDRLLSYLKENDPTLEQQMAQSASLVKGYIVVFLPKSRRVGPKACKH